MNKKEIEIRTEMEELGIGKATFEYMVVGSKDPMTVLMYAVYEHRKIDPSAYIKKEA